MTTDAEAEAALPPGVARGTGPGKTPEDDRLTSGGVGPGGQVGPQPETRDLQERPPAVNETTHEGPISSSPFTQSPTREHGTGGAAAGPEADKAE